MAKVEQNTKLGEIDQIYIFFKSEWVIKENVLSFLYNII